MIAPVLISLTPWPTSLMLTLQSLPYFLIGFVAEAALYGIHFVIFCLCARILLPRRRAIQRAMLGAVVIMFILATIDVIVSWRLVLRRTTILYSGDSFTFLHAIYPKIIIHLISNLIADALLLIRCYVVWGRRSIILYIAGPLLLAMTLLGFVTDTTSSHTLKKFVAIYTLCTVAWNLIITLSTAGRILWISQQVKHIMGPKMVPQGYHFAVGILVESGFIYTVSTLLVVILARSPYLILGAAISIRVAGIMPILLIVQVATGNSTQDVQKTVSKLQGGDTQLQGGDTQQIVLDTIISSGYGPEEGVNGDVSTNDLRQPVDPKSQSSFGVALPSIKS